MSTNNKRDMEASEDDDEFEKVTKTEAVCMMPY
jgi:hypothetical protein